MPRSAILASQTASALSVLGRPGTFLTSRALTSQHANPSASSSQNTPFQYCKVDSITTRVTSQQRSQSASSSSAPVVVA
jgi:hypothetical protein